MCAFKASIVRPHKECKPLHYALIGDVAGRGAVEHGVLLVTNISYYFWKCLLCNILCKVIYSEFNQ